MASVAHRFIPAEEFRRVLAADEPPFFRLRLIADMARLQTLSAVQRAGSGHLGTSFSAMELFVYLYLHALNVARLGPSHPDRDVFFSSKGHDCPAQYVVMAIAGLIPFSSIKQLRRLGGLAGHPDVGTPGIEAHTGSLGMGISKAKGMAIAKRLAGRAGRVVVLTGDGELQEGQIWEALQTTAHQRVTNLTALVDHNRIQSDRWVADVIDLGPLDEKFKAMGWRVRRIDGHDFDAIDRAFQDVTPDGPPTIVICDTVKGKGVSFMEGPAAMAESDTYRFHSGALTDASYLRAWDEIHLRVQRAARDLGCAPIVSEAQEPVPAKPLPAEQTERLVGAYGEELVALGGERPDLVVLDADLADDCGLRPFERAFPSRFIEHGIAEQDMVSTAGGLARLGFLPIVNSFGAFLCSRANEQAYINALERTRIIYVAHYAGVIPAAAGQSHQSLRDISLFAALPRMAIVQPFNGEEARRAIRWAVHEADVSCLIRLVIGPAARLRVPEDYVFTPGHGVTLRHGTDALVVGYGPTLLAQALGAADVLASQGVSLAVVNLPWLNLVDAEWLRRTMHPFDRLFVLDDHQTVGGLGDRLLEAVNGSPDLRGREVIKLGIQGEAACGRADEVLAHHGLDAEGIARTIGAKRGRR
jgi:transketolase